MIIQECPALTAGILDHIRAEVAKDRPGWHLSDLLFCSAKTLYRKLGMAPPMTDETAILFWTGHAFQYFLQPVRPDQAKVYEIDGIKLTPDFEDIYFGAVSVGLGELKTTRKSMRDFDPQQDAPHYLTQLMGYAYATGKLKAHLIIFFLMGNYKPKPWPTVKTWEIEFTPLDLDENWKEILRRKVMLEKAIEEYSATKVLPQIEVSKAFSAECVYCECREFCIYREAK